MVTAPFAGLVETTTPRSLYCLTAEVEDVDGVAGVPLRQPVKRAMAQSAAKTGAQRAEEKRFTVQFTLGRLMRLPGEIEDAFRSGATILTANVRAARWLRREYARMQRSAGRNFWASPPIEDWESWLRRVWQAHSVSREDSPLLLTSLQERWLWTRMQRGDAGLLVSPEGMAALAEQAYALLCAYEAHAERNHVWAHKDAESFRRWAAEFDRECAKNGWMSGAHLEGRVTEVIEEALPLLPAEIVMAGFDRITPAQKRVIAAMEARGTVVRFAGEDAGQADVEIVRATDARDEMTACAWWVRKQIELGEERRIGVLAPDAGALRGEMERIFRRVLMPETDDVFASTAAMPFEFSLGKPLASVPVVRAALLLLRWVAGPLREEEVSWLLLSGYVGGSEAEYLTLARFDERMRDSGTLSLEIQLTSLLRKLRDPQWVALDEVRGQLEEMRITAARNRVMEETSAPSRWVELAQLLLKRAGWPGRKIADTVEFQALAKWELLLEEVALLDFDGQRMQYAELVRVLENQAGELIFAPESQGAPVQIMGALEASGQQFDVVWFLGADDQSWPPRGRMHPLLPGDAQRRAGMPHASAEADWELARLVTERIAASAPEVIFSHALRDKDGELRPSPLIEEIAPGVLWRESRELIAGHKIPRGRWEFEEIADDSGVIAWPREQTAGGADVLKRQAACPFQAFATTRLGARELNRSDWGLSAAERGKLLHRVMEELWSPEHGRLHTLDDLQAAIAEGRLRSVVESAIGEVFAQYVRRNALNVSDDAWMRAYLANEQRRLIVRVEEWLELEAKRAPFAVEATEQKLNDVRVGDLKLNLRADRIDRTEDGKHLLLDYKSGVVKTADWKTMRPNEPQLPLYAVFGNVDEVCGVLFARIRVGETGFSGVVSNVRAQLFPDVDAKSALTKDPYTDAMRDEWTEALLNLAEDFLRGEAAVDPRDKRKTCEFCPLPGLCRIAEVDGVLAEEPEAEEENGDE